MNRYMTSNAVMDIQRPSAPSPDIIPPTPQPTPGPLPPTPRPPQVPQQPPVSPPTPQPAKKPGRRKGPVIAIVIVVVVVLSLIAGAVFYYFTSIKKGNENPTAQTPTETPVADDGHIDPEDIDATTQKIDSSLSNLNDSNDFGADDLNDSTLGL